MTLFEEINRALNSAAPHDTLRSVVLKLVLDGSERSELLKSLGEYRSLQKSVLSEAEDDIILEVMDYLAGWCSPHMKIPPEKN